MKIGVMGGTFDPVHLGHIAVAEEARASLDLSQVWLVPAGQPLLKSNRTITPAEHRLRMLHLAVDDIPYFKVSDVEIGRPGPSYTVDTMAELRQQYRDDDIFFILGLGSLAQLPEWREPSRLIETCNLVVVPRPGCSRPNLEVLEASIPGISKKVIFLDKPHIDISASAIRERAAQGLPLRQLVPELVAEYISRHKLYSAQ